MTQAGCALVACKMVPVAGSLYVNCESSMPVREGYESSWERFANERTLRQLVVICDILRQKPDS